MDPSMILYTEDSPHFHSAKDAVNAHSASPWRSAGPQTRWSAEEMVKAGHRPSPTGGK